MRSDRTQRGATALFPLRRCRRGVRSRAVRSQGCGSEVPTTPLWRDHRTEGMMARFGHMWLQPHVGIPLERGPPLIACSRNPALRASFDTVPCGTGAIGYRGNRLSSQEHGVDVARQCECGKAQHELHFRVSLASGDYAPKFCVSLSGTQAQHGLLCCIPRHFRCARCLPHLCDGQALRFRIGPTESVFA